VFPALTCENLRGRRGAIPYKVDDCNRGKIGVGPVIGGLLSALLVLTYVLQRVYWMDVLTVFIAGAVARGALDRFRRAMRSRANSCDPSE